ncbi:MAG: SGNH/GDSL hydrolase family protein [Acidobacteriota bacterium]
MTRHPSLPTVPALAAALLLTSALCAPPPSAAGPVTRVLLVGDSWSEFMWIDRSMRDVFAANGRPDIVEKGDETAISGSTAEEWAQPSELQRITDELDANPTIDVVQLTIGGNDFLAGQPGGGWYAGIPPAELEALYGRIVGDVTTVLDHVLAHDPDLTVVVSLYDHPNFVDSLGGLLAFLCVPKWNELGQPTPEQINTAGMDLQERLTTLVASRPRTNIVDHTGLMQFVYGFPPDDPPGTLLPPGDLTRPSPIEAMRLQSDCFHLRADGNGVLAQNLWDSFYDGFFNGLLFRDGFESGSTTAWSAAVP